MEKPKARVFHIDKWRVSPPQGLLTCGSETARLEPKTMEVLVYFASRPNEVITREELEQDVWHGAVVGYDAVTNTIIKLRKALQDNAREPHVIATIPKKGYQLIASISYPDEHVTPAEMRPDAGLPVAETLEKARMWPGLTLGATAVAVLLAAGVVWLWSESSANLTTLTQSDNDPTLPSIVILPFESLSPDSKQEYLADGVTDDIITDLSRLSNILVISGNTSKTYKNRQISARKIADDLNVKYILKGSVRLVGDKIRINTQLYNAESGFNVWAQRYDRKVDEIFAVQDDVTQKIVNSLTIKMTSREKSRLAQRATDSLKAYDYFQEGQRLSLPRTEQALAQARESYKKAIEFDPNYGRAYGALAVTMDSDYIGGWGDAPVENLDRALALSQKAVELDSSTPQTYWALGFTHMMRKEYDRAERAVTHAITIAPNYADGYGLLALIKMYRGQPEQALKINEKGKRLNPYYSWQYLYTEGWAHYMLGNYQAAITALEEAQQRNESGIQIKLILAAAYVNLDKQNDAEWLVEETQAWAPKTTITEIDKAFPLANQNMKNKFLNDLRQAGLPE